MTTTTTTIGMSNSCEEKEKINERRALVNCFSQDKQLSDNDNDDDDDDDDERESEGD
jgi:hypothetical protein